VDAGSRQNSLKIGQCVIGQGATALVQPQFDKKLHHAPNSSTLSTVTLTLSSPIVKSPLPSSGHAPTAVRLALRRRYTFGISTARARSTMNEGEPTHPARHVRTARPEDIELDYKPLVERTAAERAPDRSRPSERVPVPAMHSIADARTIDSQLAEDAPYAKHASRFGDFARIVTAKLIAVGTLP